MNLQDVIIRPLITEKSMRSVDAGKYSFEIAKTATKYDVKNALKERFNVTVVSVTTTTTKGKKRRVGARRQEISVADLKKAVVTLKKGEKLGMFEPGGEEQSK